MSGLATTHDQPNLSLVKSTETKVVLSGATVVASPGTILAGSEAGRALLTEMVEMDCGAASAPVAISEDASDVVEDEDVEERVRVLPRSVLLGTKS